MIVERAQALADDLLFPTALATDALDLVPRSHLDALAETGLYGLVAPASAGGLDADSKTMNLVIEALASGCLTTTFVWTQHLGASRAAAAARGHAAALAAPMASGTVRAGVAFAHLRRPGAPMVIAEPTGDGEAWTVSGVAPWVTGWGRIDVVHTAARLGDDIVWLLIDAAPCASLSATKLRLAAVNASSTVELRFDHHVVDAGRVTHIEPLAQWLERDAAGLRTNGSLSLGLARRATSLLGRTALDDEIARCRAALDNAAPAELPAARAAASELAVRAASAVMANAGGRSIVADHHGQRLGREALFLLVQGQTPAIKAAQRQQYLGDG